MKAILCVVLAASVLLAGCGDDKNISQIAGPSAVRPSSVFAAEAGIQCSDAAPVWITQTYSTDKRSFQVNWKASASEGYTYEVLVRYSRSGERPLRVLQSFRTGVSNAQLADSENGGYYFIEVHVVHNPCGDVDGAWSNTLVVIVSSGADEVEEED